MDVREKLVELQSIITCPNAICNFCEHFKNKDACEKHKKEVIADNMIANGVTVQEWISVKDRLPEKNTSVVTATDNGIVFQCLYAYDGWDLWEGNNVNITHWQPMPQPPKGE